MPKCRACDTEIQFIKSALPSKGGSKHKWLPCEMEKLTIVTPGGEVVQGYAPHWGNCTDPGKFRNNCADLEVERSALKNELARADKSEIE